LTYMNSRILTGIFCLFLSSLHAQVLRDMDYSFLYNPTEQFIFTWKVIKLGEGYKVLYDFTPTDTTLSVENIKVQFETRGSLSDKTGKEVSGPLTQLRGSLNFNAGTEQKILVANVSVGTIGKVKKFTVHKHIPTKKSPYIVSDDAGLAGTFINTKRRIAIEGSSGSPLQVSYYRTQFPASAPVFSTAQSKLAKTILPDSVFMVAESSPVTITRKGLYLAQYDTASAEGIAFRAENDYPKLATLESLTGPLLYVCTKQEIEKLKLARNDKKKFDQVILTITGSPERARSFMRSYFKRVEYSNIYFSSYKEGWKTDRGMIYIIYGPPDEVYLFDDREIWDYKNENLKTRFQFAKSPTLFDPDNYVLIRDKKYTTNWYKTVDFWRKARF
jgi:GWxTD domain-containing protein